MEIMELFSLTLILFLIMDPVGKLKMFLSCLKNVSKKRYYYIVMREMVIALIAILFFNLIGECFFHTLGISQTSVNIASGLILFLVAINIVFSNEDKKIHLEGDEEPFIVPLAIPVISNPALLATVMLYASSIKNPWTSIIAILVAWFFSCLVLLSSKKLLKKIGIDGISAAEKLMGLVLILLAVQRILQGLTLFAHM